MLSVDDISEAIRFSSATIARSIVSNNKTTRTMHAIEFVLTWLASITGEVYKSIPTRMDVRSLSAN